MTPKTYLLALAYAVTGIAALTFLASLPNSEFVIRLARLTLVDFAVAVAWPIAAVLAVYFLREPLSGLFHYSSTAKSQPDATKRTSAIPETGKN